MRPLDGTTWAGLKRVRHSNLLPARNDRRAGEIASLTPASAACMVPVREIGRLGAHLEHGEWRYRRWPVTELDLLTRCLGTSSSDHPGLEPETAVRQDDASR